MEEELEEMRLEEMALQRRVKLMGVGGGDVRVGSGEEVGNAGQRTLEQVQHRKAELGNSVNFSVYEVLCIYM